MRHGINGLIYDAEDHEALVAAVARLAGGLLRDWQEIIEQPQLGLAA